MTRREEVDDLRVLARRGELATAQARQLELLLARSLEERVLDEAGRRFDEEGSVRIEDEQVVARLIGRIENEHQKPRRKRSIGVAGGFGLGVLLAAATAVGLEAAQVVVGIEGAPAEAPSTAVSAPTPAVPGNRPGLRSAIPTPSGPTEVPPRAAPPTRHGDPPPVRPEEIARTSPNGPSPTLHGRPMDEGPVDESPGSLFVAGNRARARSDVATAMSYYLRLVERFPNTPEASAARLSLGVLYLQARRPTEALEQFRRSRQTGATTAEGLFGEAEAYRQLGLPADERRLLGELVKRYPESAYAVAASQRLQEVD